MKHIVYYNDRRGNAPVKEYLDSLTEDDRAKCLEYIDLLEIHGEKIRRPIGDYLGGKLYELRPKQTRIIYFFIFKNAVVLAHAFRKKTDAVPVKELRIATERMNDYICRQNAEGNSR